MRAWIDIDNAPQVQYLLPLIRALRDRGDDVTVTARDHGMTLELLRETGVPFIAVGSAFGVSKYAKAAGLARRSAMLWHAVGRRGHPDAVIAGTRPAAVVARAWRVPAFIVCDYEYVDLSLYRMTRSRIVHPDVIPAEAFISQGFAADHLIGFHGINQDLTFSGYDLDRVPAHHFNGDTSGRKLVLLRPAAEESHYYAAASGALSREVLGWLARRPDIVTVFSPRYEWQLGMLSELRWSNPPIALERGVPFLPLLKAVDTVISAGGTMLREAAYMGVQALSIFRGKLGAVDAHLMERGRLRLIQSAAELEDIAVGEPELGALPRRPDMPAEIIGLVAEHLELAGSGRGR